MNSNDFLIEARDDVELAFQYERKYDIPATDALQAIYIKNNCQPFLQACKKVDDPFILYRGVNAEKTFIDKEVRLTDRRPLTMQDAIHNKINDYLDDNYGHPYRNAMFCTGSLENADYGTHTYWVFPKGKYDFLYSNNTFYDDLYMAWQKWSAKQQMPEYKLIQHDDIIDRFLSKANYQSDSIINAAASQSEIMMWCNEYYGIRSDYDYWEELTEIMYEK